MAPSPPACPMSGASSMHVSAAVSAPSGYPSAPSGCVSPGGGWRLQWGPVPLASIDCAPSGNKQALPSAVPPSVLLSRLQCLLWLLARSQPLHPCPKANRATHARGATHHGVRARWRLPVAEVAWSPAQGRALAQCDPATACVPLPRSPMPAQGEEGSDKNAAEQDVVTKATRTKPHGRREAGFTGKEISPTPGLPPIPHHVPCMLHATNTGRLAIWPHLFLCHGRAIVASGGVHLQRGARASPWHVLSNGVRGAQWPAVASGPGAHDAHSGGRGQEERGRRLPLDHQPSGHLPVAMSRGHRAGG